MGQVEAASSKKNVRLGFRTKTRRGTKERDRKLQDHCANIRDVEVVRVLYYSASGKRMRT